jgi:MFS family permease
MRCRLRRRGELVGLPHQNYTALADDVDFDQPQGALLGIMSSAYNLGAICALPLVPYVNDRFGRRWAIFLGSWIMVIGSVIQAFSISGMTG